MNKILAFAAAAFAAGSLLTAAQAAPVSFVQYAAGNEHGVASGTSVNIGGVNMTFLTNPGFFAYFDDVDLISQQPGGLGVCRQLTATFKCNPGSDDSIDGDFGTNEFIKILFDDGPFDVRQLSFNDGQHNPLSANTTGQVMWMILNTVGGVLSSGVTDFANLVAMAAAGFFLGVDGIGFQFVDTEFYVDVVSDVPLPAALPLLLSGLAGLGFAARRKKAA